MVTPAEAIAGDVRPARRVLLIDDEPELQTMLAEVLRETGCAVELARSAAEARRCLAAQTYDLVITDWKLPDGDGVTVADWAAHLGAKTLVMSGYLSRMPGGRAPGHETLMKPFRVADFIAVVKTAVG
jgi:two-component system, NtrC family, response regulator PilR